MTKLINGVDYNNPHMQASFGDYLIINGFSVDVLIDILFFSKDGLQVMVQGDQVYVLNRISDPENVNGRWSLVHGYIGISHLDIFRWMRLMDIMRVTLIKEFKDNAGKVSEQWATQATFMLRSISLTEKLTA